MMLQAKRNRAYHHGNMDENSDFFSPGRLICDPFQISGGSVCLGEFETLRIPTLQFRDIKKNRGQVFRAG